MDWMLILGRQHFDRVMQEWIAHYNEARPHRLLREYSRQTFAGSSMIRMCAPEAASDSHVRVVHQLVQRAGELCAGPDPELAVDANKVRLNGLG